MKFQSNNTYVIRDNEGRWFLLQTNAAPGAAVHPVVVTLLFFFPL